PARFVYIIPLKLLLTAIFPRKHRLRLERLDVGGGVKRAEGVAYGVEGVIVAVLRYGQYPPVLVGLPHVVAVLPNKVDAALGDADALALDIVDALGDRPLPLLRRQDVDA